MTCEELRIAVAKHPSDHTRAERATVYTHLVGCESCQIYLMQFSKPPGLSPEETRKLEDEADEISRGDWADAECKEQIMDAMRRRLGLNKKAD